MDKLAGHPGGLAGKHVQMVEITMVDGTDSAGGFDRGGGVVRGEGVGHTMLVIMYLEVLFVCVNYILTQFGITYVRV